MHRSQDGSYKIVEPTSADLRSGLYITDALCEASMETWLIKILFRARTTSQVITKKIHVAGLWHQVLGGREHTTSRHDQPMCVWSGIATSQYGLTKSWQAKASLWFGQYER